MRGYQKNDFEFISQPTQNPKARDKNNIYFPKDDLLFKNLILNDNLVEYKPVYNDKNNLLSNKEEKPQFFDEESLYKDKMKRLKEIYNEFWEFISEENETFKEFIVNDHKRQQLKQTINII